MAVFDEVFDLVVVGSGGGSMCAGLVMRSAGKGVLILEKPGLVGGTTSRSGGVMWMPNNPFMKRDGVEDSPEKAATYLEALLGDQKDAPGSSRERSAHSRSMEMICPSIRHSPIRGVRSCFWKA